MQDGHGLERIGLMLLGIMTHPEGCAAEAAFQDRLWNPGLRPLTIHADLRIIRCTVDTATAMERITDRAASDPRRAAHADRDLLDAVATGRHWIGTCPSTKGMTGVEATRCIRPRT